MNDKEIEALKGVVIQLTDILNHIYACKTCHEHWRNIMGCYYKNYERKKMP